MKKNIIVLIILSFFNSITFSFLFSGCTTKYFDNYTNPNSAVDVPADLILPAAMLETGAYVTTNFDFLNLWMGYWNWSGEGQVRYFEKNYQIPNDYRPNTWSSIYAIQVNNYEALGVKAAAAGQPLVQGMAKIMKAFAFQYLVDTYNNAPYFDASKGTSVIFPKYDDAQTIYKDLIIQINDALDLFKKGDGTYNPNSNDILFKGDISKWQKFGNSVKLKILLRQSEIASQSGYIATEMAKIKASGYGFLGAGENAGINPGYLKTTGKLNPFWESYGYNANDVLAYGNYNFRANQYAINFYNNTNDSFRLAAFYLPAKATGKFNGSYFGAYGSDLVDNDSASAFGPGLLQKYNQDAVIMSSHESLFDQAEAALKGWISGDPKTLYQAAVTESFKNLKVPNAAASAQIYYSQKGVANVNYDVETNKLALIISQKWASLNGLNPFEAWCDYRRLGLPATIPISLDPSVIVKKIPVRLLYPLDEYSLNTENVNAQGTISQFTSKIFWTK